jgi:uncharacterized membrane protein
MSQRAILIWTIGIGFIVAAMLALLVGEVAFNKYGLVIALHALAAFVWVGMLYYLNLVEIPITRASRPAIQHPNGALTNSDLSIRVYAWYRWAALLTWLTGLASLNVIQFNLVDVFTLQEGKEVFGVGAWIGTLMMLNVWIFIWPNQKKIMNDRTMSSHDANRAAKVVVIASRLNLILSIPAIMFMIGQAHGIPL